MNMQRGFTQSRVTDSGFAAHMQQVFNYMTGGVALSGAVAWLTLNTGLINVAANGATQLVFFMVWLGFGFFMQRILSSMSPTMALGTFGAFSALTGFALSPLVLVYTGASVVMAFAVTAIMFAGVSAYGYYSKKSLSSWGTFLAMGAWGLIGLIAVSLVGSLFGMQMGGLSLVISAIAVPLVAGITAYEVNMMRETYAAYGGDEAQRSSVAIYGAASLYMNFVVMFIHLLNLIGQRR